MRLVVVHFLVYALQQVLRRRRASEAPAALLTIARQLSPHGHGCDHAAHARRHPGDVTTATSGRALSAARTPPYASSRPLPSAAGPGPHGRFVLGLVGPFGAGHLAATTSVIVITYRLIA